MLPPRRLPRSIISPSMEVASAEQLTAIAHRRVRGAAQRYRELAARMRLQGEAALAGVFDFLTDVEDRRAVEVDKRAVELTGHAPDPDAAPFVLPAQFDEEEARSAVLTPYRALAIAVRNGDFAFAFYSYVAAYAKAEEVRQLAEHFAEDELAHAGVLRLERRNAWRAQSAPLAPPEPQPETLEALLAEAVSTERAAAVAHRDLARRLRMTEATEAAGLFDAAAEDEESLARILTARLPTEAAPAKRTPDASSIRDGLKLLELAFERYMQIVERATVEAVLLQAQTLGERALRRLIHVRGALEEAEVTSHAISG